MEIKNFKGGVVGTLMSNYGLEKFLSNEKIRFSRSKVGDRYVKENEKSSIIIWVVNSLSHYLGKFTITGDGLLGSPWKFYFRR